MHTPSDKSYSGFERRVVKLASQHAGLPCGPFSQHLNRNRSRASCTSIIMQNGIFFPAASADYVGARRSLVRQYSVFVADIIRFWRIDPIPTYRMLIVFILGFAEWSSLNHCMYWTSLELTKGNRCIKSKRLTEFLWSRWRLRNDVMRSARDSFKHRRPGNM